MVSALFSAATRRLACFALLSGALLLANPATGMAGEQAQIAQPAEVIANAESNHLNITSADKQWSITWEEKSLLGSLSDIQQALYDIPVFYEGSVINQPGSWIRLMLSPSGAAHSDANNEAVFTGHIYADGLLHELQHRANEGGYFLKTVGNADLSSFGSTANTDIRSLLRKASGRANVTAGKAIKIGIVIDNQYNDHYNGRGLAHALGIINGVDGLYQSQLGLALVVETFRVYDNPEEDPLANYSGTVEQVLDYFREIRFNDTELPAELALVHIFSGHQDPQKVIGLGWIDTVCRNDGYDLSISTPFTYDILLSAHEIAHNLGAVHDDDANCEADSSVTGVEIMWAELSGDTQPQFSACSLDNMRSALEASCVLENIDVGIQLSATPTGASSNQQRVAISVANQDDSRSVRQIQSTTAFPIGTELDDAPAGCTISATTLSCQHGSIPGSYYHTLSLNATFSNTVSPVVTSELTFDEFVDTQHLNNRASLQVSTNQPTVSADINSAVSPAEVNVVQEFSEPANDGVVSTGGSAGVGNTIGSTRLIDIVLLALAGALMRTCRARRVEKLLSV